MEKDGIWIKYEKSARGGYNQKSSYYRLFEDLKDSSTAWHIGESLDICRRELCGEDFSLVGSRPGDIHVFYVFDENGNRIPKIYFKTIVDREGQVSVTDIHGANLVLEEKEKLTTYNFNVEPCYLPALIEKLCEVGAEEKTVEKYEKKLASFQSLCEISSRGVETDEDILTLYRNFTREDTALPRRMMKGRCVQADFDGLSEENQKEFFRIICRLNYVYGLSKTSPTDRLNDLTVKVDSLKDRLLEVSNREMVVEFASESGLKSLYYANSDLRNDRDFVLEVLRDFKIELSPLYERNLPEKFWTDIEVLTAMTASKPFRLREVLESYLRIGNRELKNKLEDIDFVNRLLQIYYGSILADKASIESSIVDCSMLWLFSTDILKSLDNSLLIGPEPTPEREQFKRIIEEEHLSTREKIMTMRQRKN